MKNIFLLFSLFVFFLLCQNEVSACSCAFPSCSLQQNITQAQRDAEAVFSGTVLEINKKPQNQYNVLVKLRLIKSWKGNSSQNVIVETGKDSAMCGYPFEVGKSYLIYADGSNQNVLGTDLCTHTKELEKAGKDIEILDENITQQPLWRITQEETKAILLDELGTSDCQTLFKWKLHNLGFEVLKNPNFTGYILINGDKNDPLEKYLFELKARVGLNFLHHNNRIFVLQGADGNSTKVQFWRTPPEGRQPAFIEGKWDYKLPPTTKPIDVSKKAGFGDSPVFIEFYSKLLLANPDLRGHFVITGDTVKEYSQTKEVLTKELSEKYNIPRKRLKFFYSKAENPDVEFWLVPIKPGR